MKDGISTHLQRGDMCPKCITFKDRLVGFLHVYYYINIIIPSFILVQYFIEAQISPLRLDHK